MRAHVMLVCLLMLTGAAPARAMPPLALANALQRAASSACVAAVLDADGASLYQASLLGDGLSGYLKKFDIAQDASGRAGIGASPIWDAGRLLGATPPQQRPVFTAGRSGAGLRVIALDWEALDEAQRRQLDTGPGGAIDNLGRQRLAHLRGARDAERAGAGGMLRQRASLIGATLEGGPVLAGRGERAGVYLAANDGMLHAFDAASGREWFSYLPFAIQASWSSVTAPAYRNAPFIFGAIAAGDAMVRGKRIRVLAGGMGSAAAAIYALDISEPARFGERGGVLFEFTSADDADLGFVFGAPVLARVRIGAAGPADYLVVGGGYNGAGRGRIALFLLSLDKEAAAPWQLNRNYFKLVVPVDDSLANGLAGAALAEGDDGNARYAYAGDLQGNLWRFDLEAAGTDKAVSGKPFFTAADDKGKRQPITTAPRVVYASDGFLLLFGTGSLLAVGDAADNSQQTLYGVRDHQAASQSLKRADLIQRSLTTTGRYRARGPEAQDGWYFDLPGPGERSVSGALVDTGQLVLASLIPGREACKAQSRLYWLDALSGKAAPDIHAPFLLPADAVGRMPLLLPGVEAGLPDGRGQRKLVTNRRIVGAGARPEAMPRGAVSAANTVAGRLGWREIIDHEALRNAASQR